MMHCQLFPFVILVAPLQVHHSYYQNIFATPVVSLPIEATYNGYSPIPEDTFSAYMGEGEGVLLRKKRESKVFLTSGLLTDCWTLLVSVLGLSRGVGPGTSGASGHRRVIEWRRSGRSGSSRSRSSWPCPLGTSATTAVLHVGRVVLGVLQACDKSLIFITKFTAHQGRLSNHHHVLLTHTPHTSVCT